MPFVCNERAKTRKERTLAATIGRKRALAAAALVTIELTPNVHSKMRMGLKNLPESPTFPWDHGFKLCINIANRCGYLPAKQEKIDMTFDHLAPN